MRKADKPALGRALINDGKIIDVTTINSSCIFVIDDGALLHHICWLKGSNFQQIDENYASYLHKQLVEVGISKICFQDLMKRERERERERRFVICACNVRM